MRRFLFIDLGLMDYERAHLWQLKTLQRILHGSSAETIFLAEHPPVITWGRTAKAEELLQTSAVPVIKVERGGGLVVHNPGQLVFYPLVRLRGREQNVRRVQYVLEELAIALLKGWGITGTRRESQPGVWTAGGKIAFLGLRLRKWTTFHGLALNVNNNLELFRTIRPCGLSDGQVTSMSTQLGSAVSLEELKQEARALFEPLWHEFFWARGEVQ